LNRIRDEERVENPSSTRLFSEKSRGRLMKGLRFKKEMLYTLLLVIPFILAAVLFLYTTAGILIHLRHVYVDARAGRHSPLT
jgi:hypothetical protein